VRFAVWHQPLRPSGSVGRLAGARWIGRALGVWQLNSAAVRDGGVLHANSQSHTGAKSAIYDCLVCFHPCSLYHRPSQVICSISITCDQFLLHHRISQLAQSTMPVSVQRVQTSVCHQLHVFVVKVGKWRAVDVGIGERQRADRLVRSVAARSFAQIHRVMIQSRTG